MRTTHLRSVRGTATVELALVAPLLIVVLLFSVYLTELVRAKLKLHEAARYAAWELTTFPLSDFARGDHATAWKTAHDAVYSDAMGRFGDLDSVEPDLQPGFIADTGRLQVTLEQADIPFLEEPAVDKGLSLGRPEGEDDGKGLMSAALAAASGGPSAMLGAWGFNPRGQVSARVSLDFHNRLLPRSHVDTGKGGLFSTGFTGGRDLTTLTLSSHLTLYADTWSMPDGKDATVYRRRAGAHRGGNVETPHGLYQQVKRMTFLGVHSTFEDAGLGAVLEHIGKGLPNPMGTFVVSHNYGPQRAEAAPDCVGIPSYPGYANDPAQDARGGLNSFYRKRAYENLDGDEDFRPRCFDTAPFRDRMDYAKEADASGTARDLNAYVAIFKSRGDHFMGCKHAQAEDPSERSSRDATAADENTAVVDCE